MLFSLAQTLVCVLLINGGMYALHLTGNGGGGGGGGGVTSGVSSASGLGGSNINPSMGGGHTLTQQSQLMNAHQSGHSPVATNRMLHALGANFIGGHSNLLQQQQQQQQQLHHQQQKQQHAQHTGGGSGGGGIGTAGSGIHHPHQHTFDTNRLNQELADMAQLERERLMLMGLAKQTADAAAESTGHHGRPIIAGRIQMHPHEEEVDVSDYPSILQQAARGLMFGNVVKEAPVPLPSPLDDDLDYDGEPQMFARRPIKYDYGRVVQPADRELEYEAQHFANGNVGGTSRSLSDGGFGDFDDFMELEAAADDDDLLADLDNYQYHGWEEQQQQQQQQHHRTASDATNPYAHTFEDLELGAPKALQELFEKEQRVEASKQQKQQQKQQQQHHGIFAQQLNGGNIRMQQKWARKRGGQQSQQQTQYQRNIFGHHFGQQPSKLSLDSSEATATKHLDNKVSTRAGNVATAAAALVAAEDSMKKNNEMKSKPFESSNQQQLDDKKSSSSSSASSSLSATEQQKQQQEEQLLHPNRKRSGSVIGASSGAAANAASYMQTPQSSHSLASQLMLRTARGQRQYDVPQIECPTAMDGMERFACPTPDLQGRYRCIDDHVLCDGFIDCPEGEDEDRRSCMFYKTTKAHLDVLADALLRWARGR